MKVVDMSVQNHNNMKKQIIVESEEIDMLTVREELECALVGAEKVIVSNQISKDYKYRKVEAKPVIVKGCELYQISCYTEKQVFQENVEPAELADKLMEHFPDALCQMNIFTAEKEYGFKMTKKGRLLKQVQRRQQIKPMYSVNREMAHDRKKNYILQEGTVIPPLVDMGIFTKEGKVVKSMYDKFKQINRFIEMVDDVLKDEKKEVIHIIDFGCGKIISYLYYLLLSG